MTSAEKIQVLKDYALANPGTEWDLLPKQDHHHLINLIGAGRKPDTIVRGVGEKLRAFRTGDFTLHQVAAMDYAELAPFRIKK